MNSYLQKLFDRRVKWIIEQEKREPIVPTPHPLVKDGHITLWETSPGHELNLPLGALGLKPTHGAFFPFIIRISNGVAIFHYGK